MKPKLAVLNAKTKEIERDLAVQRNQIKTLQNRESGVVGIHTNPRPSWPYTQSVTFQTPFESKPTVTYGLYLLDTGYTRNTRVTTEVTDVTKTGLQVKLNTWADTELYGARISWMACGQ
uniref:H-type lectin domain-containing protein n=1 Tax=Magallana gigas TaxID=29159 RepID=A0A8W8L1W6_MAGGI